MAYSDEAQPIQGAGPNPNDGYPVNTQPAPGAIWNVSATASSDLEGSGSLTNAGDEIVIDVSGRAVLFVQFTGALTAGVITLHASADGTTWDNVTYYNPAYGTGFWFDVSPSLFYSAMSIAIPVAGANYIRLRAAGGFAGPTNVIWRASILSSVVAIGSAIVPVSKFAFGSTPLPDAGRQHCNQDYSNIIKYACIPLGYDGVNWQGRREPSLFKSVATMAAGNTPLWTPAAGKRFRLMRYMVSVTGDASFAAAANLVISLFDGAAGVTGQLHNVFVPLAAGAIPGVSYASPWIDLGNGFRSSLAGSVLNVNLSAALATGLVTVIACGTEE